LNKQILQQQQPLNTNVVDAAINGEQKEEEKIMTNPLKDHKIVSDEKWIEARKSLLKKEKELTALRGQLNEQRRELL
jgi:hypothetical protein